MSASIESARPGGRLRSVAARILGTYAVVLVTFLGAAFINIGAYSRATEDAEFLRTGLLPLALRAGQLQSVHQTYSTELASLGEKGASKASLEHLRTSGRLAALKAFRKTLETATRLSSEIDLTDLSQRADALESDLKRDEQVVGDLVSDVVEPKKYADVRAKLIARSARTSRGLDRLERDVAALLRVVTNAARARETVALTLLVVLGGVTVLVGLLMALYARRVLSPISLVTRRAQAVARGTLTVGTPLGSPDEIGELSRSFESMLAALLSERSKVLASERLAAIGKMGAHVTHEIRNPLNAIALNLDLLEDELPRDDDEARTLLSAIASEVERLRALTGQYLAMAKPSPPEFEATDLLELAKSVCSFLEPEFSAMGIELELASEGDDFELELDSAQFRQALLNLLKNAREAAASSVRLRLLANQEMVFIEVDDDGPGVAESERERLFDPFFTTKSHGTGLGLPITDQIVKAHGGKIGYEVRGEGGSRFVLAFPRIVRTT